MLLPLANVGTSATECAHLDVFIQVGISEKGPWIILYVTYDYAAYF